MRKVCEAERELADCRESGEGVMFDEFAERAKPSEGRMLGE